MMYTSKEAFSRMRKLAKRHRCPGEMFGLIREMQFNFDSLNEFSEEFTDFVKNVHYQGSDTKMMNAFFEYGFQKMRAAHHKNGSGEKFDRIFGRNNREFCDKTRAAAGMPVIGSPDEIEHIFRALDEEQKN